MNGKTKVVPRRKYSKGWAILSEACKRTTRRRMSEGLVEQCILAKRLRLAF
jgi:ribosomal protein S7